MLPLRVRVLEKSDQTPDTATTTPYRCSEGESVGFRMKCIVFQLRTYTGGSIRHILSNL